MYNEGGSLLLSIARADSFFLLRVPVITSYVCLLLISDSYIWFSQNKGKKTDVKAGCPIPAGEVAGVLLAGAQRQDRPPGYGKTSHILAEKWYGCCDDNASRDHYSCRGRRDRDNAIIEFQRYVVAA